MSEMITVNVRLSNADKETVEADKMGTVLDLKEAISAKLSVPSSQQRLIYKGRVLKDASTLEFYGIENDHTIHMVKSGGAAAAAPTPPAATPIPATTTSMNGNPASTIPNMSAFGGMPNIPNLGGNQNAMMQQMLSNPEMMNQMLESPMMQNMLNNPEMMRNMMLNNPEMQSVLNANPQLRQALNDPAMIRQSMEMMRNPHAREQAMRSQDLMMSQLENHPRGFDALRRMQEDIADPMAEAAANASAAANTTRSTPTPATLQNPWAQPSSTTPNPWGGMGGAGSAAGMGGMNMADMMGQMGGMSGAGAAAGMGGMPAMDPNQMAALMNNPMMQQQMQMMLNDPAMIQQMTAMNPQLGPMLQNPQVRAMLSNPALMQQMMNPANMQAMQNMQQSMRQLQSSGLLPPGGMGFGGMGGANPNPVNGGLDFSALLGGTAAGGVAGAGTFPGSTPAPVQQSPQERFSTQLGQLEAMGFADNERNIRILTATNGDVNATIERLLSGA